ncbi:MAG: CRISPR system precrRNA processing endoribonuclease RAMP protein Cas6 [Anaerolineae bacterium]|nr:CRISPR system precrRNA processing endoribonuclease RAMP protein Cas6 [Anaerolineae bacterium]
MSLLAAVIHLSSDKPLRASPGRAAQAWLLDTVRQADPAFAHVLHSGQSRRPYTVGFLPRESILRITSVSHDLSRLLIDVILPRLQAIRLAGVEATITAIQTDGHPWAGRADYEALARTAFDNRDTRQWRMEFATPTAFHHNGMDVPLPLPALVYGSLIQAWNTFSPIPLPVHLGGFIDQAMGIARHRITTRVAQFGKAEQHVGFVGTVNYIIKPTLTVDEIHPYVSIVHLLTQFAFYTGVGIRTTVGMGMVRPLTGRGDS